MNMINDDVEGAGQPCSGSAETAADKRGQAQSCGFYHNFDQIIMIIHDDHGHDQIDNHDHDKMYHGILRISHSGEGGQESTSAPGHLEEGGEEGEGGGEGGEGGGEEGEDNKKEGEGEEHCEVRQSTDQSDCH